MYKFEKLRVWKKSMEFCKKIYEVTKNFPESEVFGITSQLKRAVTSIPLNIAEGSASNSKKEFIYFLRVALRSQYETVTIIKLAKMLGYITLSKYREMMTDINEIGKLLQALINSLQKTDGQEPATDNQKPTTNSRGG